VPPPPPPPGTRDKTALFRTRKKNSEKKFSFLFIEQIVILTDLRFARRCFLI
jgi:hypothetical protein